jgi:hypothetical protein
MPATAVTLDGLLKDIYPKIITRALNNMVVAINLAARRKRTFEGRQAKFPAHVGRNLSTRFLTPGGSLAVAQSQVPVQWTVPIFAMYPHIRITSDIMARTRSAAGAFARALAFETEGSMDDMRRQANRAAWGVGDGKISEVSSYSAGSMVVTLRAMNVADGAGSGVNGNAGSRYIRLNDIIDIYQAGGASRVLGAQVSAVTYNPAAAAGGGDTITLTGGTFPGGNPAAGDGVYLSNPDQTTPTTKDPMGWGGIIDDGTFQGTMFGLSRTTYPLIKSQVLNIGTTPFATGPLSQQNLQRLYDLIINSGGTPTGYIVSSTSVRLQYLLLNIIDRRYNVPYNYDPGFKEGRNDKKPSTTLRFNDRQFITDNDCPWQTLFMIPDEGPEFFEMQPPRPIDDGGGMLKLVPGTAGLFAVVMEWFYNLGVGEWGPNRYGVMRFISATPDAQIAA